MSHAPTAEEIAAHEAGIGAPIGLAAIEGAQEPLAPPNVEGGQAVEGVQPRGDEEEEHVNILTKFLGVSLGPIRVHARNQPK